MTKAKLDKIFGGISILVVVIAACLTFSGTSIAGKINLLQAVFIGDGKFYPMLTIAILIAPVLILLLPVKILLLRKNKTNQQNVGNHKIK